MGSTTRSFINRTTPVLWTSSVIKTVYQYRFLLHGSTENWRRSMFGTSYIGARPNLTPDSDSPSVIYSKTGQNKFFTAWMCRKPEMFYFSKILARPNLDVVQYFYKKITCRPIFFRKNRCRPKVVVHFGQKKELSSSLVVV